MADAAPKAAPATEEAPGRPPKKKKSRPTNCLQSNKRIRRKDWYYRNGKYFANKAAFKIWQTTEAEKAEKEKAKQAEEKAKKAEADAAAAAKPAAEAAPAAEPA